MIETKKFYKNQYSIKDVFEWVENLRKKKCVLRVNTGSGDSYEEVLEQVRQGKNVPSHLEVVFCRNDGRKSDTLDGNSVDFHFTTILQSRKLYEEHQPKPRDHFVYKKDGDVRKKYEKYFNVTEPEEFLKEEYTTTGIYSKWTNIPNPIKFPFKEYDWSRDEVVDMVASRDFYINRVFIRYRTTDDYGTSGAALTGNALIIDDDGHGKVTFTMKDRLGEYPDESFTKENFYAPANPKYFKLGFNFPYEKTKYDYWEEVKYNFEVGDIVVLKKTPAKEYGAMTPTDFAKIVALSDNSAKLVFVDKTSKVHNDSWSPYRGLHHGTVFPQVNKEIGPVFEADYIPGETSKSFEAPEIADYDYAIRWDGEDVTTWSEDTTD